MHVTLAGMIIAWMLRYVPNYSCGNKFYAIFDEAVLNGRLRFFSRSTFSNSSTENIYSMKDIGFGSIEIILQLTDAVWAHYIWLSFVCGALPLTFYFATRSFRCFITNDIENGKQRKTLYVRFKELKALIHSINNVWPEIVLLVIIDEALNIVWLHEQVATGQIITVAHFLLRLAFLTIGVMLMAKGCKDVK